MSVTVIENDKGQLSVLAKLRAENEVLRYELRQIKEALTPSDVFPGTWGLTPSQRRIMHVILAASPRLLSKSQLTGLLCDDPCESPDPKIIDVHVCKIRRKLSVHCPAASIETVRGGGYRITRENAAILKAILVAENATAR